MSEIFNRSDEDKNEGLPLGIPMESMSVSTHAYEWQACGMEGFWIKPLYEQTCIRNKTWLMKVDAGAWSPPHNHEDIEQILVLQGSFYDAEKTYHEGDFIVRAPGATHTAGSEDGCIVLLVYCPADAKYQ